VRLDILLLRNLVFFLFFGVHILITFVVFSQMNHFFVMIVCVYYQFHLFLLAASMNLLDRLLLMTFQFNMFLFFVVFFFNDMGLFRQISLVVGNETVIVAGFKQWFVSFRGAMMGFFRDRLIDLFRLFRFMCIEGRGLMVGFILSPNFLGVSRIFFMDLWHFIVVNLDFSRSFFCLHLLLFNFFVLMNFNRNFFHILCMMLCLQLNRFFLLSSSLFSFVGMLKCNKIFILNCSCSFMVVRKFLVCCFNIFRSVLLMKIDSRLLLGYSHSLRLASCVEFISFFVSIGIYLHRLSGIVMHIDMLCGLWFGVRTCFFLRRTLS
jgi:hypothetical protein